jgi:hypothetical protein
MSGLFPSPLTPRPPSPRSGARGRKLAGITQIHWDLEFGVLRNVGNEEGSLLLCYFFVATGFLRFG